MEDILFWLDVVLVERKNSGPNGMEDPLPDLILSNNPNHCFAFGSLSKSAFWVRKEFSSEVDSAIAAFRGLSVSSSGAQADLTQLFRIAAHQAKKSQS